LSKVISIFAECPEPIEQFVSQVGNLLSVAFRRVTGSDAREFEGRTEDSVITIRHHDFENDRDMKFEEYTYEVQFRAIRDRSYELHERKTLSHAQAAFAQMKSALRCDLMLVDDLQRKLDEYRPASEGGPETRPTGPIKV
jgi:hypothetical protein